MNFCSFLIARWVPRLAIAHLAQNHFPTARAPRYPAGMTETRWPAYLRIPPFVPAPCARRDGWTALRQGEFVGWLAQTGCVTEAAARVGVSRESAYRLRRREGSEGFAAAWDFALAAGAHIGGAQTGARAKFTPAQLPVAAFEGLVHVRMRRGRYAGCGRKPSDSALMRLMKRLDRACAGYPSGGWA